MIRKTVTEKIAKVFVIGFIIFVLCSIAYGYLVKYDTENHGKISIGKYVSQDRWSQGELNYFIYYINGKQHKANGGRAPQGFHDKNIGKFYRIQYSTKYENSIKAFFDKQVTDSVEILKSGFSSNEIK